ncbi:hypothetical protein V1477_008098 [Vespula maculifrons]|uniref:Uncharacterized protein n=1 Tax=Vespula maculifrons TaxID=7453 RepID=A0ABD2CHE6_VESMC
MYRNEKSTSMLYRSYQACILKVRKERGYIKVASYQFLSVIKMQEYPCDNNAYDEMFSKGLIEEEAGRGGREGGGGGKERRGRGDGD